MKEFNFIFGECGSGKSTEAALRVKAKAEIKKENKKSGFENRIYVLVPDQYTLSVEKFYMSLLGPELMVYVRVFSFKRFCRLVIEKTFGASDTVLGNVGRKILALTAVKNTSSSFEFYPAGYKNIKFINLMAETFRTLKSRGISPERFSEIGALENSKKLRDIAISYAAYDEMFSGEYFDPDDLYTLASKEILSSEIMRGISVFADQFKTFNAKEREILVSLFESGADVTVTALCDGNFVAAEENPMWGVEKNIKYLMGKIKKLGGNFNSTILSDNIRFKNEELKFISKNLFKEKDEKYEKIPEHISVYRAADLYDEVENVASEISELIKNGYKYSDIAVTARDIDKYTGMIAPVFEEYDIPVFYHRKTPLKQKSPMTFILSVVSAAIDGYSSENVLSAYKTGFLNADENSVSLLENYFEKWPSVSFSFERPFKKRTKGFGEESIDDGEEEKLEILNNLREYFIEVVSRFKIAGEKNTVKNYASALYDVITFVKMPEKLAEISEFYEKFEEYSLYSEQLQVYDMIIKILDEMVFVCGEKILTLEDFRDVLISASEESDIAILPTSADQVVTGTVAMFPFMSQKVVFILGCAEYSFPGEISENTLFTDEEVVALENYDIEIGMTMDAKVNYEKFLFTFAILSVSEKCFLSYPIKGLASSVESSYIGEIKKLFPKLSVEESPVYSGFSGKEKRIRNYQTAFEFYSRTGSEEIKELLKDTEYYNFIKRGYSDRQSLSLETSEKLFGKNITLSASKANLFSKCPFSYFIEYGLNIHPERKAEINAVEFGNFMHKGLEKLLPLAMDENADIDAAISDFSENELKILLSGEVPTASFRVHYDNIMRKLKRLLLKFREEAKTSSFKTVACEKSVGISGENACPPVKIPLSDNAYVSMVGKIDRVDMFSDGGKKYYRIIDYKSGLKKFSRVNVSNGIDMQLLMYLYAMVKNEDGKALPGGVSYFNVNPTVVSVKRGEGKEKAEKELEKKKGKSGLILDESAVINALDNRNLGTDKPNLDGSAAVSLSEFEDIFKDIENSLRHIGNELKTGNIPKSPLVYGDVDGCKYCSYKVFCENKREARGSRFVKTAEEEK